MAGREVEFPLREEHPPVAEEFPQPLPETEFRLPDRRAEFSAPPGTDYRNPPPEQEFTPPVNGREEISAPPSKRKRRLRKLLYGAAALVLTALLFGRTGESLLPAAAIDAPLSSVSAPETQAPAAEPEARPVIPALTPEPAGEATPAPTPEPAGEPTPAPTSAPTPEPTPEPVSRLPEIETDFFFFSHEHYGRVRLSNTAAVHSVLVRVRDKTLDLPVYEHDLSDDEIALGLFELPMLSTGDLYMENMDAYDAINGWPEYEMTVTVRFEDESGEGEETLSVTREADFELGIGLSYMRPDFDWNDVIPPDSFYVSPWEETEEIRYVINDPDAVKDPLTVSVDLSFNGRHAAPEEYEVVVEKEEYTFIDRDTGEETPMTGYTKELVLRRPEWMPEEGTLHVHIVQYLASTGELWVRDYDLDYPQRYDWE